MARAKSYIWLLVGSVLWVFYFGKWTVPLAIWLANVCLLHFTRRARSGWAILWVWLTLFAATSVANSGVMPLPTFAFFGVIAAIVTALTLAFVQQFPF